MSVADLKRGTCSACESLDAMNPSDAAPAADPPDHITDAVLWALGRRA